MKRNLFNMNTNIIPVSGALVLFLLVMGCTPPENKDDTDSKDSLNTETSAINAVETVERDASKVKDKTIAEYRNKYPEMSYRYVRAEDGNIKTLAGNYKLEVEGIQDEQDLQRFVTFVENNYGNREMNRSRFNKNVEQPAEPVRGIDAYYEALKQNIDYPEEANNEGGTVFVEFVLDKEGNMTDVKAAEGMYHSVNSEYMQKLDKAAVDAVKNTDWDWTPAKQGDQPVKMKLEIPITFQG